MNTLLLTQFGFELLFAGGAPATPLSITCANPPGATVGAPYTHVFPASGGTAPYSFQMSQVPPGMFFEQATGELHGMAILAGTFAFTVEVTDALGATDTVDCSVTAVPASISLGGLRIWLYGVKRRKKTSPAELCGCPEPSHVKRAV